ncbi:MAG TPA: hypothetical protein DCL65_10190, partial [Chryseobacterium sp.]|nr:hypothetical protein [Chryseobacterium sp.]
MFNISCRNEDPVVEVPKGAYENGILIANEGGFSTPTASVTFLPNDLSAQEDNIYGKNNNNENLGNVFQSIGFKNDNAFLVLNVPNKIEVVNRYTFKKTATISANLEQPRYIAFTGNYTYVTNNNFYDVMKLNIYDAGNSFVKSISFDRYAEKVVASDGFVYVQTDGITYDINYNELPTGHTITRINPSNNQVDKTITLTDNGAIRDMIADENTVYVLSSDNNQTYLYKIAAKTATVEQIALPGITNAAKLAIENNKIYFVTAAKQLYSMNGNTVVPMFGFETRNIYGFNVIDGKVYIADPSFSANSITRVYNTSGTLLKTLTTGIGTNG